MERRRTARRIPDSWWQSSPVTWTITLRDGSRRACAVPFGALLKLMDRDLAESLRFSSLTLQKILDSYMELHRNKYGREFLATFEHDERQNVVLCKTTTQDGCVVARPVPTEVALSLMDVKLSRQVDDEMMPCMPQAFVDRYMELHRDKYGVDFLAQQFASVWCDLPESKD